MQSNFFVEHGGRGDSSSLPEPFIKLTCSHSRGTINPLTSYPPPTQIWRGFILTPKTAIFNKNRQIKPPIKIRARIPDRTVYFDKAIFDRKRGILGLKKCDLDVSNGRAALSRPFINVRAPNFLQPKTSLSACRPLRVRSTIRAVF